MQFITNGPDVPDALLEAHEDGNVVFFCGAGISYPAGLPTFGELVDRIRVHLGVDYNPIEKDLLSRWQYDLTLNSLEHRVVGQRTALRQALAASLVPDFARPGATETHRALLQLSAGGDGRVRLVTTNFDRIFDHVIEAEGLTVPTFAAPMLPVPKRSKWNGIAYLHGQLPEPLDQPGLDRLIVTSGDFGLAYLAERWAARFVSELFRNFVICFVGYSINDPVLRYMMDALAADRLLGETEVKAYAFGSYKDSEYDTTLAQWKVKGVVPILYEELPDPVGHAALHKTLVAWADMHRDGALGKGLLVSRFASTSVLGSTAQDDFAGRTVWALSDKSGAPAQLFSEMTPVPSLDWLGPLSEKRFRHDDLSRYGVMKTVLPDEKLQFSVLERPTPYGLAPLMSLASNGPSSGGSDRVMAHLSNWLLRYLDDPDLVLWVVRHGGHLNQFWKENIASRLRHIDSLKKTASTELDTLLADAPKGVPSPALRPIWDLLLMDCVRPERSDYDVYTWISSFKSSGLTWFTKKELVSLLTPCVTVAARFSFEQPAPEKPEWPWQVLRCKVVLRSSETHYALRELADEPRWAAALPALFGEFDRLLDETLELKALLGAANEESDRSHSVLPSIEPHLQNERVSDWGALIELARDAWLGLLDTEAEAAMRAAQAWWAKPFPLFKRLALFAATKTRLISDEVLAGWLASDSGRWLWSADTQREAMRALVLRSGGFSADQARAVEAAILPGPASVFSYEGISEETVRAHNDHNVWRLLAKVRAGGMPLSEEAQHRFLYLSILQPQTGFADDQREEFSVWTSSGFDALDDGKVREVSPRLRGDLVAWLKQPRKQEPWWDDGWRARCLSDFATTACALIALSKEGIWLEDRWRAALQAWSEARLQRLSWKHMAGYVLLMPPDQLQACRQAVSFWLRSVSAKLPGHESEFFQLVQRVLSIVPDDEARSDSDLFGTALNDPVGHLADALTSWWFARNPQDNEPLPSSMVTIMEEILTGQATHYRLGRVMLASNAVSFFRADAAWAARNVVPLFDWKVNADNALLAWTGYLTSLRFHRAFAEAIAGPFLETASRYKELGGVGSQYADLLTHIALEASDLYDHDRLRAATALLPQAALDHIAQFLARVMRGAAQPADYWTHRVSPYLHNVWPKSIDMTSQAIARNFAKVALSAKDAFPQAYAQVKPWLQSQPFPGAIAHEIVLSEQCTKHPEEALDLLNRVVPQGYEYPHAEFATCLDAVAKARPELANTPSFKRLAALARRSM